MGRAQPNGKRSAGSRLSFILSHPARIFLTWTRIQPAYVALLYLLLPFLLNQKISTVLTVPAADRIVLFCLSFLIEISVKRRLTNVRDGQKGSLLSGCYFLLYHKQADKWSK